MMRKTMPVRVVRYIDGDSLVVRRRGILSFFMGKDIEVRMYGIDAPEYKQEYGNESRNALIHATKGNDLMAEIRDTDRYGRTVALLYHRSRGRGDSVNKTMVKVGAARWYRQYGGKDLGFDKAERSARENRLGLWRKANAQAPWDYRKQKRADQSLKGPLKWLTIMGVTVVAAYFAGKALGVF